MNNVNKGLWSTVSMLTQNLSLFTLLAASTLAQTASIAALSSRRLAFFSFALLDFLWEQEIRELAKQK